MKTGKFTEPHNKDLWIHIFQNGGNCDGSSLSSFHLNEWGLFNLTLVLKIFDHQ